jgi:hypothetical protein
MFTRGETVRFMSRSREIPPMDAVIASVPFGINDVPAMGAFYFIIAPVYRGFVSADRLSRKPGRNPRLTDLFARRGEFDAEP